MYTKVRAARSVSEGILDEVASHRMHQTAGHSAGPARERSDAGRESTKLALQKARTNVAVLLDRGLGEPGHILVPVGGGIHSRMALRLASEIAISRQRDR